MPAYKTQAISLKTAPFAEADKMVTLFSRDQGKIKVLAKSARRVPSRFGGRVESFTYADFLIAQTRSIDIVSQCKVIESFQKVREQELMLMSGLYMFKIVNFGTVFGQAHPELFDLLLKSLYNLKQGCDARRVAIDFEKAFVVLEGIYQEGVHPRDALSQHLEKDLRSW